MCVYVWWALCGSLGMRGNDAFVAHLTTALSIPHTNISTGEVRAGAGGAADGQAAGGLGRRGRGRGAGHQEAQGGGRVQEEQGQLQVLACLLAFLGGCFWGEGWMGWWVCLFYPFVTGRGKGQGTRDKEGENRKTTMHYCPTHSPKLKKKDQEPSDPCWSSIEWLSHILSSFPFFAAWPPRVRLQ